MEEIKKHVELWKETREKWRLILKHPVTYTPVAGH
jgi:hypothetical protein